MLVAVSALYPVNVMRTRGAQEGRIHFFRVDSAVRHLWMAGFAGGARILGVRGVATEAAQALVHAHRRAVVTRTRLHAPTVHCRDGP